jgi:hypothetical protein
MAIVTIEGLDYSGRLVRTSSEQYTSFVNSFAFNNKGKSANAFGTGTTIGSNVAVMGVLSSGKGESIRCAMQGDRMSATGGGVCVDNKNNMYDVIYYK